MREPPYTCPLIDSAQDEVSALMADVETRVEAHNKALEEIRSANEDLREWGRENASNLETVSDERDTLLDTVQELEEKIETLEEEIASLETEIASLQEQLTQSEETLV